MTEENLITHVLTWWSGLEFTKKERNEIRRCKNIYDIQLMTGFYNLKKRLADLPQTQIPQNPQLALIVGILVNVKTSLISTEKMPRQAKTLAKLMSRKKDGNPTVSPMRFYHILQTTDLNELYRHLILILPSINNQAFISQLINDLRFWGDKVKRSWAESYYL